jgi:hypothetical protein
MPGITILGKLFFKKFSDEKTPVAWQHFQLITIALPVTNRWEKNPAQTEVVEQTIHRDRCTADDGGEERIRSGRNQAQ